MLSRRPLSIVLALFLFACAISFIVFALVGVLEALDRLAGDPDVQPVVQGLMQELPGDGSDMFLTILLWGMLFWRYAAVGLLAVMCIFLAVFLLARSGRKVHPMPLAVWGGGVLFLSLVAAIFCFLKSFPDAADVGYLGAWPFALFNLAGPALLGPAVTAAVSFVIGLFVCIFASALYRHIRAGTLAPLPEPSRIPAYASVSEQLGSAEDSLKKLHALKEAGLVTEVEYEQMRADIIKRM